MTSSTIIRMIQDCDLKGARSALYAYRDSDHVARQAHALLNNIIAGHVKNVGRTARKAIELLWNHEIKSA